MSMHHWREQDHPRDPGNGEFVEKGSGPTQAWAERVSDLIGGASLTRVVLGRESNEMSMSVLRLPDGSAGMSFTIGAEGEVDPRAVSLDRAGVAKLQEGLASALVAVRAHQSEVRRLQAEADRLDGLISTIDQKALGPPSPHGRAYLPLSAADQAEKARLVQQWEELDRRIAGFEDDGEEVSHGVVPGIDGDVHFYAVVKQPAKWSQVDIAVTMPGQDAEAVDPLSLGIRDATGLLGTIGELSAAM